VHGTIEVTPNGRLDVTPGVVNIHLLDPVPTAGLSYDERNALAETVRGRMADAMATIYGVSPSRIDGRRPTLEMAPAELTVPAIPASSSSHEAH